MPLMGTPWDDSPLVNWDAYIEGESDRFDQMVNEERNPLIFGSWDLYGRLNKKLDSTGRANLERYCAAYEFLVERYPFGPMQEQFEFRVRTALLAKFFGNEVAAHRDILREMGFPVDDIHYRHLALLYPRRMGKTTVQAAISAIIAVSQINGNVLSFHVRSRQAKMWLDRTKEFMAIFKESPQFTWTVKKQDIREFIFIYAEATGTTNYVQALPGVHQGSANIDSGSTDHTLFCRSIFFFFCSIVVAIIQSHLILSFLFLCLD